MVRRLTTDQEIAGSSPASVRSGPPLADRFFAPAPLGCRAYIFLFFLC